MEMRRRLKEASGMEYEMKYENVRNMALEYGGRRNS